MSKYASAYEDPQGPGDARPTALQIIKDNNAEDSLHGKVILITGVSSGLGIATVEALKLTGARFILTARNTTKAREALQEIWEDDRMELVEMEQSSLDSVRTAAKQILAKTDKINIFIANAGVMALPTLEKSQDGFELHFATNHLSHFLLFELLKDALVRASTPTLQSRVVMVGAGWHRVFPLSDVGDYNLEETEYSWTLAYGRSKTANTYMAHELERRYGDQGIHAVSLHPGIIKTGLARHIPDADERLAAWGNLLMSPGQGAATTVYAVVSKEWEGRGGRYISECSEAVLGPDDGDPNGKLGSHTYNATAEARLWEDSLQMVGLA